MAFGTSIFLSALLIAIVLLYGMTKDRWGWRRFAKRATVFCLVIVSLALVVGIGAYLYEQIPTTVKRQTEYAGIKLGVSPDEVLYIKGYPPSVLSDEVSDPQWKGFQLVIDTKKLDKGKSVRDYQNWSYSEDGRNINIAFDDARKVVQSVQCYSNDRLSRCPTIAGVRDGDRESDALRKLGSGAKSRFDGTTKSLLYSDLGILLHLSKEEVYMLEVFAQGFVRR